MLRRSWIAQLEGRRQLTTLNRNKSSVLLSLLTRTWAARSSFFLGFWIFLLNQVQGGGSKVMSFGKSAPSACRRTRRRSPSATSPGSTRPLRSCTRSRSSWRTPRSSKRSVREYRPACCCTGRRAPARRCSRAVAGEAGVPFFSISGSDSLRCSSASCASRVRDLFEQAKPEQPVHHLHGRDRRHRPPSRREPGGATTSASRRSTSCSSRWTASRGEGQHHHDRCHQPARTSSTRAAAPRRFDRQIAVDRPDRKGQAKILEVHTRGKPLAKVIDIDALAGQTPVSPAPTCPT